MVWKDHATQRLLQRKILKTDAIQCILNGEIIEKYVSDKPFASCLVFGYTVDNKVLHIVTGTDGEELFIITAYYPNTIKFQSDLKTRREN